MGFITRLLALFTTQKPVIDLAALGKLVVAEAERLWNIDIHDPKVDDNTPKGKISRAAILHFIQHGLVWKWIKEYKGDGYFEWCGAFMAECWQKVGMDTYWLLYFFSSTFRLERWGDYEPFEGHKNPKPKDGPYRLVAKLDEKSSELPFEFMPGMIVIIGPAGSGPGKHICVGVSYDKERGIIHTIEGNGTGLGPKGDKRQGVVKGERPLGAFAHGGWHVRRVLWPAPSDITNK